MKALIINCSPVRTGATAEIVNIIADDLSTRYDTKCIRIDDYEFSFCRGCRACHNTASCVMSDAQVIRDIMKARATGKKATTKTAAGKKPQELTAKLLICWKIA